MKSKRLTKAFAGIMAAALVLQSVPAVPVSAKTTKAVVSTQKQLDAALRNKKVSTIEIKTSTSKTLTVKSGNYKKDIVVNAPKAKVVNAGKFEDITVKNASTFTEKADNNKIEITDKSLSLTVAKGADNSKITVDRTDSKVNVKADGKVAAVMVDKKASVKVNGATSKTVKITSNASGVKISVAAKASVQLNKSASVTVAKGGKVSTINAKASANVTVADGAKVTNVNTYGENSTVNVKADGTLTNLNVNKKAVVNVKGETETAVQVTSKAADTALTIRTKADVNLAEPAQVTAAEGADIGTVVAAKDASITVAQGAAVDKVEVKGTDAKVDVEANGTVSAVSVSAKADVSVSGTTATPVKVDANTEGATITASTKADVTLNANVNLNVKEGAEIGTVTAAGDAAITVDAGATVTKVEVQGSDAKVNVEANGTVGTVSVDAKADVTVSGTTTTPVKVDANTEGATISTSAKADVTLNANANVSIEKGAEGSSIKTTTDDIKANVSNNTDSQVIITDSKGTETKVDAGKTEETNSQPTQPTQPSNPSGGSSSGGGSPSTPVQSSACDITDFAIGDNKGTISDSNITVKLTIVSGASIDLSKLTPTITVSDKASVNPAGGAAQDFSNPVTYTVTAEDGTTTKTYTVTVEITAADDVTATATIGTTVTGYATLDDAVTVANDANTQVTVKLWKDDAERTSALHFEKNKHGITLDLNGKTISRTSGGSVILVGYNYWLTGNNTEINSNYTAMSTILEITDTSTSGEKGCIKNCATDKHIIMIFYGSKLTLSGGVHITYPNAANSADQGSVVVCGDMRGNRTNIYAGVDQTTLTVKNAIIDNTTFGVCAFGACTVAINEGAKIVSATKVDGDPNFAVGGNGTHSDTEYDGGTVINITGGEIDGGDYNAGIYQPQNGQLNITGGTIKGCVGVEVKAGTVNISENATIISASGHYQDEKLLLTWPNSNSSKDGVSSTKGAVDIIERASYDSAGATVNISGGNFEGAVKVKQASKNEGAEYTLNITGGTFNPVPSINDYPNDSSYTAEGCVSSGGTGNFTVTNKQKEEVSSESEDEGSGDIEDGNNQETGNTGNN